MSKPVGKVRTNKGRRGAAGTAAAEEQNMPGILSEFPVQGQGHQAPSLVAPPVLEGRPEEGLRPSPGPDLSGPEGPAGGSDDLGIGAHITEMEAEGSLPDASGQCSWGACGC